MSYAFQVEHFSRYGLVDLDDDEEGVEDQVQGGAGAAPTAATGLPAVRRQALPSQPPARKGPPLGSRVFGLFGQDEGGRPAAREGWAARA